jgi:ankyrin repeat protein
MASTSRDDRLRDACKRGDLAVVQQMLAASDDAQEPEAEAEQGVGRQGLLLACASGHVAVAELLLQYGVDVDAAGANGWTALMAAAMGNRGDTVELLLHNQTSNAPTATRRCYWPVSLGDWRP